VLSHEPSFTPSQNSHLEGFGQDSTAGESVMRITLGFSAVAAGQVSPDAPFGF
jgi:hypothetical protein